MTRKYRQDAYNRIQVIDAKIAVLKKQIADLDIEVRKLEIEKEGLMSNIGKDSIEELNNPAN